MSFGQAAGPASKALLLSVVVAFGVGCGRDKRPVYTESEEIPPIEVPPGLTAPDTSRAFVVPGAFLPQLAGQRDDSRPPRVLPSDEARLSRSRIRSGPHGLYLEVDDEVDSVFHRLGFSLNRGGMSVLDVNREEQRYQFRFTDDPEVEERRGMRRLTFWRRAEVYDYSGEYQVRLEADGSKTRIHILGRNGGIVDLDPAETVLEALQDRLG